MESTFGWIDLSAAALRKLRQELEVDADGVRDEMGVLGIHTGYAERFFPGTSVLHKRPRYVFFTCWNYLRLDDVQGETAKVRKEIAEDWVKRQLGRANQKGIIGARVDQPAQPVDYIYWTALRRWGMYRGPNRSNLLSKWNAMRVRRVESNRREEEAVEDSTAAFLVPKCPSYWLHPRPREPVTFELTREEADFLQKRLESLPCILSGAATRARRRTVTGEAPWLDEVMVEAVAERRETEMLERARRAASFGHMIRGMYAALVERRRNETTPRSQLNALNNKDHYRLTLGALFKSDMDIARNIRELDLTLLAIDLPRLPGRFLSLLKYVKERVKRVRRQADVDELLLNDGTLELFSKLEEKRKPGRARLPDNSRGAERREGFNEKTVSVVPVDYRWDVVRTTLRDLHNGLRSGR
jgi:Family of unknown function (DUF6361)